MRHAFLFRGLRAAIVLLLSSLAAAQAADAELEEIIVTAGFRDAELLRQAGSVSVLESQRVQDRAAWQLSDMLGALPNVSSSSGGARARFIQMRGIGDLEQFVDPKHYPSVGVLIDGMEIGATATGAVLSDVRQVEVLRGPQGTRFGSTALAGIVNIRTRDPGEVMNGAVKVGYGARAARLLSVAAGGPLTDNLGGRIAAQHAGGDGFIDNAYLGRDDTAELDELSLHGKLVWSGGGNTLRFSGLYLEQDNGYDAFSLDNNRVTLSDEPGRDRQQTWGIGLRGEWALSETLWLEAQLHRRGNDELYAYDEDWLHPGFCGADAACAANAYNSADRYERRRDALSMDARLKSEGETLPWVAGAYAQLRDESLARQYTFLPAAFHSDYDTERYAVYGQIEYAPVDNWNLRAGLRLERFRDEYHDSNGLDTRSRDTYWSGEFTLEYLLAEHTLLYATASRGGKPGGVNTDINFQLPRVSAERFQPFLAARLRFDTETLFNKEAGIKGRYLDRRLRLRLALFHADRDQAQLENWVWDGATFIWTGMLDSADAQNYGGELALDYRLHERLSVFANLAYLQTNVDRLEVFDLDQNQFIVKEDREQAKAPNWQYNIGLAFSLSPSWHGRLEAEGRDSSYYGYYHDGKLDSHTLVHASVRYQHRGIAVQGWARNLFNQDYAAHGLYVAADPRLGVNRTYTQLGEPRAYGFTLAYDF